MIDCFQNVKISAQIILSLIINEKKSTKSVACMPHLILNKDLYWCKNEIGYLYISSKVQYDRQSCRKIAVNSATKTAYKTLLSSSSLPTRLKHLLLKISSNVCNYNSKDDNINSLVTLKISLFGNITESFKTNFNIIKLSCTHITLCDDFSHI